jgi:SAM-dependent methyltransferase
MHKNALIHAEKFYSNYCAKNAQELKIIEIGSLDVNGSIRNIFKDVKEYIGIDFEEGPGVDKILTDPYEFPFEDNVFDVLATTSCFEHSEMFWLTFLEGMRILKPNGLFYLNVPSDWIEYHRYPVDCWRFYPDSSKALETWGRRNKIPVMVLESYISTPTIVNECSDLVSIFLKDQSFQSLYPTRIVDNMIPMKEFFNAYRFPINDVFTEGWNKPAYYYNMGLRHPLYPAGQFMMEFK